MIELRLPNQLKKKQFIEKAFIKWLQVIDNPNPFNNFILYSQRFLPDYKEEIARFLEHGE